MTRRFPISAITLAAALNAQVAWAQQSPTFNINKLEQLSLEEILDLKVVTASGVEEDIRMAPANVVVISAEDIALHGWHSLTEILGSVPGLYVVEDLVTPSLGVRGVTGGFRAGTRIVKIMIDGVEVNFRPELNALIGPEYVPVAAIERVEVAKGPLSAVYGANAFLATVNVITQKPKEGYLGKASLRVQHQGAGLGYGLGAMASYSNNKQDILLAITGDRIDRSGLTLQRTFDQDLSLPRNQGLFNNTSSNDITSPLGFFGKASQTFEKAGVISLRGGLQRFNSYAEFQPNSTYTHQSQQALLNGWLNAKYENSWTGWLSSVVTLGYSAGGPTADERLYLTGNQNSYYYRRFGYTALDGSIGLKAKPSERFQLSLTADITHERHRTLYFSHYFLAPEGNIAAGSTRDELQSGDRTNIVLQNVGVRLQATGLPLENGKLKLSGNLSVDFPNQFAYQVNWRGFVGYSWTPSVSSRIIVGRSFQAPSAVLMYGIPGFGNASNIIGNFTTTGRARITPQDVQSAEFITSAVIQDIATVDFAAFAQILNGKIEFVQTNRNFLATNQGISRNGGFEVTAALHLGPVSPYLKGTLQWLLGEDTDGNSTFAFSPTASYPSVTVTGGTTFTVAKLLRGSTQVRFVGARGPSQSNLLLNNNEVYSLPAYAFWDASVSNAPFHWLGSGRDTVLTLSGRNLLSTKISEAGFDGFDMPILGRAVVLELSQTF